MVALADQTVLEYQEALTRLKAATEAAQRVFTNLREYNGAFNRWDVLIMEDRRDEFPGVLTKNPGNPSIESNAWPSAADLESLLLEYHNAKAEVHRTWGNIPTKLQEVVVKPPE